EAGSVVVDSSGFGGIDGPSGYMGIDVVGGEGTYGAEFTIRARERDASGAVVRISGTIEIIGLNLQEFGGTGELVAERRPDGSDSLTVSFQSQWTDPDS